MKRRAINVFNLAFLDIITCGLGAIILLFVIVNAKSAVRRDTVTADFRAHVNRLEEEVLSGRKHLARLRNSLEQTTDDLIRTQGAARRVIAILEPKKVELAERENNTLATKAHVNRLKADLKSLEEKLKRLRAGAQAQDDAGTRLLKFPGRGDRQYLTDLKMGGQHIFILVDASASMLDETIVGIIRRRNRSDDIKRTAAKWRQAVATVTWLTARLPTTSKFQVYTFAETAAPLIEGTRGTWLAAGDPDQLNKVVAAMRRKAPGQGTSLINAVTALQAMQPPPDNIFLLTDSLPTMGKSKPWRKRVTGDKRLSLFKDAARRLPPAPVNVILFPMEGDPLAADAYWRLARTTRGSFLSPSTDWP